MKLKQVIPAVLIAALTSSSTASAQAQDKPVRVTVDNFRRAESDTYFAQFVKEGGFGKFPPPDADADRPPGRRAAEPRHAVLVRGLRPRRGAGDGHAAGRRQAVHGDADRQRGPLRAGDLLRPGKPRSRKRRSARATSLPRPYVRESERPGRREGGPRSAGRDQGRAEGGAGKFEVPDWDHVTQEGPRPAPARAGGAPASCGCRTKGSIRSAAPGHGRGLGRQPPNDAVYAPWIRRRTTARPRTG